MRRRWISRIERLEGRTLFSGTVIWDGGGGTALASNPLNWSNDLVPDASNDVVIASTAGSSYGLVALDGTYAFRSLTISVPVNFGALTVSHGVTFKAGGRGTMNFNSSIDGSGTINIEVSGALMPFLSSSYGSGGDVRLPVNNYGEYGVMGDHDIGTVVHNFNLMRVYEGGNYFGSVINEPTGKIEVTYLPNIAGSAAIVGVTRDGNGTRSASPFVNRGFIYQTRVPNPQGPGSGISDLYGQPLTICLDASPRIGGRWQSSNGPLLFTSLSTTSTATAATDDTFRLAGGTLNVQNLNLTLSGMDDGTALKVLPPAAGRSTVVTLAQPRTSLQVLQLLGGTLKLGTGGHVLRVPDVGYAAGATLDVGDGTFIDANQPYWGTNVTPFPTSPPLAPTATPAYAEALRATVGADTLTVNVSNTASTSTTRGLGYARGDGLATCYPAGTFSGEVFDTNDFIFRATLRGDANLDRDVDFDDLLAVAQHYGKSTARGIADGNFNDAANTSGAVDFDDLLLLAKGYGQTLAVAPATAAAERPTRRRVSDVLT